MSDLMEFLTSEEIMVVYVVAGISCLLCFIKYIFEKSSNNYKKKQNTRELNRLVVENKINEVVSKKEVAVGRQPVVVKETTVQPLVEIQPEIVRETSSVVELLESTAEMEKVETTNTKEEPAVEKVEETPLVVEKMDIVTEIEEEQNIPTLEKPVIIENIDAKEESKEVEELQYTSIEPDQATAKLELEKLTEELRKQEAEPEIENIALTNYEEEQEENAIISLEELVKKSKEMYAANELTQYADEGNEPISLQDLERKMGEAKIPSYDEPFIIANVVPEEELTQDMEEVSTTNGAAVTLQDFNTVELQKEETVKASENVGSTLSVTDINNRKFQSSPIISPIYGIERPTTTSSNELELENTANYEKLDEEIKKTNEFLMTLRELQKKLD